MPLLSYQYREMSLRLESFPSKISWRVRDSRWNLSNTIQSLRNEVSALPNVSGEINTIKAGVFWQPNLELIKRRKTKCPFEMFAFHQFLQICFGSN